MALKPYDGEFTPLSTPEQAPSNLKPFTGEFTPIPLPTQAAPAQPEHSGLARRVLGDSAIDLGKGVIDLGAAAVGLADLGTGGYAGKALESVGYDPQGANQFLSDFYSPERQRANQAVDEAKGFLPTLKAMVQNPSTIAGSVLESAPSTIGGGVGIARSVVAKALPLVERAAPALARFVPTVAGGIGEGAIQAGQSAEQSRATSEDKLLSAKQAVAAVGSGAVDALISSLGGATAQKLGIADIDTLLAGGKVNPAAKPVNILKRALEGVVQEGVLEELPQSAQEQMWQNYATGQPLMQGVPEAAAQGALVGAVQGGATSAVVGQRPEKQQTPTTEQPAAPTQADPAAANVSRPMANPTEPGPLTRVRNKLAETPFPNAQPGDLAHAANTLAAQGNVDTSTGEYTPPTDEAIKQSMHEAMEQQIASAGRISRRSLRDALPDIEAKRFNPLLDQVLAERKQGITAANYQTPAENDNGPGSLAHAAESGVPSGGDLFASSAGTDQSGSPVPADESLSQAAQADTGAGNAAGNTERALADEAAPARAEGLTERAATQAEIDDAESYQGANYREGEPGYAPRGSLAWTHVADYPLSRLKEAPDANWFDTEQQMAAEDGRPGFYNDMLDREIQYPIIVHDNGEGGYIWDGNHRVAAAGKRGLSTIKAIVGRAAPTYDTSDQLQEADIVPPSGEPYTHERAAQLAAGRVEGGKVFPVEGGFVVRVPQAAAAATAPTAEGQPHDAGTPTATSSAPTSLGQSPENAPADTRASAAPPSGHAAAQARPESSPSPVGQASESSASSQADRSAEQGGAQVQTPREQREAAIRAEVSETRQGIVQVAQPTPVGNVKVQAQTLDGAKNVNAKLYELPNYNGPQLAIATYKTARGEGYRVYLPKSGHLLADNNGVGSLYDTLRDAVQRVSNARQNLAKQQGGAQAASGSETPVELTKDTAHWERVISGLTEPNAHQRKLIEAARDVMADKSLYRSGTLYNDVFDREMRKRVTFSEAAKAEKMNVERGATGYEMYLARKAAEGEQERAANAEASKGFAVGAKVGTFRTVANGKMRTFTGGIVEKVTANSVTLTATMKGARKGSHTVTMSAAGLRNVLDQHATEQEAKKPAKQAQPAPSKEQGSQKAEGTDGFIRSLTSAERASQREKNRGWQRLTESANGREVVFKPRGERGPGFYYAGSKETSQPTAGTEAAAEKAAGQPTKEKGKAETALESTEPVATLSGNEVAQTLTAENAVQAARAYFRQHMQGKPIHRDGFGDVRVTGKSLDELRRGMKMNPDKVRLLPAIRPVIESGAYEGRQALTKSRKDNIVAFHRFSAPVSIAGETKTVRVLVGEDRHGNLLYDVFAGNQEPPALSPERAGGAEGSSVGVAPTDQKVARESVEGNDEGVNVEELSGLDLTPEERASFQRQQDHVEGNAALRDLAAQQSREEGEADAEKYGLRKAVTRLLGPTGVRVQFLRDLDGLPEDARNTLMSRNEGRSVRTAGLYDPATQQVYLFTSVVKDPARAAWHAAHEIAGHDGLRKLLGPNLDKALTLAGENPTVAAVAKAIARERNLAPTQNLLATEEALAELAAAVRTGDYAQIASRYGVEVPKGIREKVVEAIKDFLRRLKNLLNRQIGREAFTDQDVRSLLEHAWQAAQSGENGPMGLSAESTTAATFYSALARSIETAKGAPKRGSYGEWRGWLDGAQRRGEFKQSERDWLGLDDFIKERGAVTRDELAQFVRENQVQVKDVVLASPGDAALPQGWYAERQPNGEWMVFDDEGEQRGEGDTREEAVRSAQDEDALRNGEGEAYGVTKFASYQLPGGENYRELLLTLPRVETEAAPIKDDGTLENFALRPGQPTVNRAPEFRSSHFDQPNILAHVRFNERTDADGKRVLFIEEIQSDWHQQGRKRGYRNPNAQITELPEHLAVKKDRDGWFVQAPVVGSVAGGPKKAIFATGATREDAVRNALEKLNASAKNEGVPNAPFKSTDEWAMLAFKRMVREAAEKGFDRIAWTTGEQQAERYDLSKQVSRVSWNSTTGKLIAVGTDGLSMHDVGENVTADKLADFIGKEAAEKLQAAEPNATGAKVIEGDALKVGGQGMHAFYDKILPAAVNKWAKRFGGKVGEARIETDDMRFNSADPEIGLTTVHAIDITPAMRDAALSGQPLFSTEPRSSALESTEPLTRRASEAPADVLADVEAVMTAGQAAQSDNAAMGDLAESTTTTGAEAFRGMTREQFLGEPKITPLSNAEKLRPNSDIYQDRAPREPFMGGKYEAAIAPEGAVVFDGKKVIASYHYGDNLVVSPKYRRRGIGEELVYQWHTRYPGPASSQERTRPAQALMEKVWDRIQRELAANTGNFDASKPSILESTEPLTRRASETPADVLADVEAVMTAGQDKTLLQQAKDKLASLVPSKVKNETRHLWLAGLSTDMLAELGSDYNGNMAHYAHFLKAMNADRNELQQDGDTLAEAVRQWGSKHTAEAKDLFKLMHQATIDGVDPAKEYQPLQFRYSGKLHDVTPKNIKEALGAIRQQMRERSGDSKQDMLNEAKKLRAMKNAEPRRKAQYPTLKAKWDALTPEAQQFYTQMRDMYQARSQMVEDGLVARIEDTDAPENQKRKLITVIRQQFETQRLQGVYFPLQRFGQYFVAAEKGDASTFLMFESQGKLEAGVKMLKDKGFTITAQGLKSQGKAADAPSGTFVAEVIDMLKKAHVSEKTQDDIYQAYLQALPELSMRKHAIHRKAVPGFDPDAVRGFAFNMLHGAHQIARLRYAHKLANTITLLRQQQDAARKEPDADTKKIVAFDGILNELDKRHQWIMNPTDSKATGLVSSFGFIYYLGLTPAAAMVNLTQTALLTFPYLAARHGPVRAMNHLLTGMRDTARTFGHIQKVLTDPDELAMHAELIRRGLLDKTQAFNLAGIAEGGLAGHNPQWAKAMSIIGMPFHKAEVFNREASAIAAYRLARQDGATHDAAVDAAARAVNDTHFDYTNQNRARVFQSGTAKTLLMFRQYSLNMTWHLGRMVWQATKNESPEVRKLARRNLAGVLGMSAIFSGTLGLPLMSVTFGVLNAIAASFGNPDEPWDAETEFKQFLDDLFGKGVGEALANGPVNALTGADIASRVSLSQLWFRDADRELDGEGAYYNLLEQAAGPMGGVLKNTLVGKQLIDQGHTMRGIETMLPKALKDAVKAQRYASEGVNNLRGDPLVPDVSLRQTLLQLAGFTPDQVAQQYDVNRSLKNYEQAILDRRARLIDAFAMALRTEDDEARQEVLARIQHFNQTNPEIAITTKGLRQSIGRRARYSQDAENGIVLNRRLAAKIHAEVGD